MRVPELENRNPRTADVQSKVSPARIGVADKVPSMNLQNVSRVPAAGETRLVQMGEALQGMAHSVEPADRTERRNPSARAEMKPTVRRESLRQGWLRKCRGAKQG